MILSIVMGFVSTVIGLFGWAQIVGSLQNVRERGTSLTIITILISAIVMVGLAFLVWKVVLVGHIKAWLIGYAISLVLILGAGKIQ